MDGDSKRGPREFLVRYTMETWVTANDVSFMNGRVGETPRDIARAVHEQIANFGTFGPDDKKERWVSVKVAGAFGNAMHMPDSPLLERFVDWCRELKWWWWGWREWR